MTSTTRTLQAGKYLMASRDERNTICQPTHHRGEIN
jgi:hypothetical protein